MKTKRTIKEEASKETEVLFTKEQLLTSKRFQNRRDLLNALLSSEKQYTIEAVEQSIEQYLKGKVK